MLFDLHAHYPMHVAVRRRDQTHEQLRRWRKEWLKALVVRIASLIKNYQGPGDTPGVTLHLMRRGNVGVIFSTLHCPLDEIDHERRHGAPPQPEYFGNLIEQLEDVEADVAAHQAAGGRVTIATSPAELKAAIGDKKQVLIHAIEGGFSLGASAPEIKRNVQDLADRGVACITVAHLLWRMVATNSNALPFMSDRTYQCLFPQPAGQKEALTDCGEAVLESMIEHGILIDITHMSEDAMARTFALAEQRKVPLVATHGAWRRPEGGYPYNLGDETIKRIAATEGVVGLIMSEHFICDGREKPRSFKESFELLCTHIDHIREITGSDDHVAFGTDIDGFIKPALRGLEHLGQMRKLQAALNKKYPQAAEQFSSENALRVLEAVWRKGKGPKC
jgi:microsomal dipeptidase-like Zn-dependent dipeptidase